MSHHGLFSRFSHNVALAAGRPVTFIVACAGIAFWAISGPLFGYSETWQLVVNTATTIITFLMVFVLQNSQNRDGMALQTKLDELIIAVRGADNRFVGAEELTVEELQKLRALFAGQKAREEGEIARLRASAAEPAAEPAAEGVAAVAPALAQLPDETEV